jgi:acylphosphatase
METHRQVFYAGRVQGVGFRYSVKQIASGYEVIGWVRNLPDGRVELFASGKPDEVEAFIDAIAGSHLGTHIKDVEASEANPPQRPPQGFEIRH